MTDEDIAYADIGELRDLMASRQLSPRELIETTLSRIERSQPVLNAFITVCADEARRDARRAEDAILRGQPLGPLHGIPFTVKDNIATAKVRTTFGSRIFEHHIPERDAVAVARARAAGAILVGKTTTPEFAFLGMTEAPLFGRTVNPWRPDRTCGGSSGGAGAAIAAGLGTVAIATDAGGSIRIPAACNGVVAIKQSLGLVPHDWADDVFGNTQYVSPMARTVVDTAILLDVIAGPDPSDPHSLNRRPDSYAEAARSGGDLQGVRIQWRPLLGNAVASEDVIRECEAALARAVAMGARVEGSDAPFENQEHLIARINASSRRAQYGTLLKQHRSIMCPKFVRQLENVSALSAEDLWQGLFQRTRLFHQIQGWFDNADLIAMPTLARGALPIDQDFFGPIEIDGKLTDTPRRAWYPYTIPFNATGHPALTIPCGLDRDGLPVGLQLVGRIGTDAEMLRIGALLEKVVDPIGRPPLPHIDDRDRVSRS